MHIHRKDIEMKKQSLCAVLAALLLTACTGEPTVNSTPDSTAPSAQSTAAEGSETAAVSTESAEASGVVTAPQLTAVPFNSEPVISLTTASGSETTTATALTTESPAGDMPQFVIIPAPAETFAPVKTTKPAVTTEAKPDYNLRFSVPLSLGGLFAYEDSADLAGTGLVHAKDGLRLRDKPSAKGKQLGTVKDGASVEILGVAAAQDLPEDIYDDPSSTFDNRWFRVRADGKEGYANARYIAAKFSQKMEELSKRQLRVLTAYLYCQSQDLFVLFAREGGFKGRGQNTADSFSTEQGLYEQVQPSTIQLSDVYEEFYQYFSKSINKDYLTPKSTDKAQYYAEKNGKLYTNTSFGDNVWLDYDVASSIISISETEIKADAWWNYTPEYAHNTEGGAETPEFSLVYEDGVWKIGTICHIY